MRQTTFFNATQTSPQWKHVDATGQRLGRLASDIAVVLMGKHKPEYTPHVDTGDFVIVTNAENIEMTGNKAEHRLKLRYSGYPGGQKAETYAALRQRRPEFLIEDAVRRMLPKNRLGRQMLKKLKVYRGPEHPHQAQSPTPLHANA
ncbi:MAG: 50S ribosomal protein L13 [Phycisphaerales bacterium]